MIQSLSETEHSNGTQTTADDDEKDKQEQLLLGKSVSLTSQLNITSITINSDHGAPAPFHYMQQPLTYQRDLKQTGEQPLSTAGTKILAN